DPRTRNTPPPAPPVANLPPAPVRIPDRRVGDTLLLHPSPAPAAVPKKIPLTERIKRWFQ
ncbi:MAG: hypothetical protein AAFZ52_11645, partial [Bacteroidota bacterium]